MVKRLLCLFSAFIVLFSASVPAYAMGTLPIGFEIGLDVASLADLLVSGARIFGNSLASAFDSDVCGHAPQIGGGHKFVAQRTQVDGQVGLYYVCEYCGKTAGEVLDNTYEAYVSDTYGDFTEYSSSGNIPVRFFFNGVIASVYQGAFPYVHPLNLDDVSGSVQVSDGKLFCNFVSGEVSFATPGTKVCFLRDSATSFPARLTYSFVAPVSGTLVIPGGSAYRLISYSSNFDKSGTFSRLTCNLVAGQTVRLKCDAGLASVLQEINWADVRVLYNAIDGYIVPVGAGAIYDIDSRVFVDVSGAGSTGAYGYVENGQLVQSTVGTIYNEITNVYQNPVTGETSSVESWTYDYSDRSYMLNTDEGDTVTVTYGDSNVTINEGGDTYNVYYLVEHQDLPEHNYVSSVTLAPTCTGTGVRTYTCTDCGDTYTETIPATGHSYQSAVIMPSTCTNTGVRTFTCSVCGDSYTTSIPATGHTWQVLQTVSTEYDENGQLVREGYTIYQCSTCGEQYRIASASGGSALPSPSSGGTSTGGTDLVEIDSSVGRGFLVTIAHGLTEDLPQVLQACSQWFTEFPRFYSGFVAFLTDGVSSCYPAEYKMMMSFGIGMVTIIGIVRKILGR